MMEVTTPSTQALEKILSEDTSEGFTSKVFWSSLGKSEAERWRGSMFKWPDPYANMNLATPRFAAYELTKPKEIRFFKGQYYGGSLPSLTAVLMYLNKRYKKKNDNKEITEAQLKKWLKPKSTRHWILPESLEPVETYRPVRIHAGLDVQFPRKERGLGCTLPYEALIIFAGYVPQYGYRVEHVNIWTGVVTSISHMTWASKGLVEAGKVYQKNTVIGYEGHTSVKGVESGFGNHMHMECAFAGAPMYLPTMPKAKRYKIDPISGKYIWNMAWVRGVRRYLKTMKAEDTSLFPLLHVDKMSKISTGSRSSVKINKNSQLVTTLLGQRLPSAAELYNVGYGRNPWFFYDFAKYKKDE